MAMAIPCHSPDFSSIDPECNLLSESLSLETLSTASLESIPPFPPSQFNVKHMPTIVCQAPNSLSKSTTTIPTPPRLRSMLKENLSIRRWTESLPNVDAPGHTPWGDFEDRKAVVWVPEGSMYASEEFQEALANARRRSAENAPLQVQETSRRSSSFRDALVFEREITLRSDGKTKRWSVQVPAKSMKPEMVDVMLELRDLNSFFKASEMDDLESEDGTKIDPPVLMVSNSHCAMPLSLESTASLASHQSPQTAKTLAIRRGQQNLPSLKLADMTEKDPYPDIPTAFRGSPSYSPTFEYANSSRPPMSLQEMIVSLRSQCASLQIKPVRNVVEEEHATGTHTAADTSLLDPEEDEWAFAHSLLHQYRQAPKDVPQDETVTIHSAQEVTACDSELGCEADASPSGLSPSTLLSSDEHRASVASQTSLRASIPLSNSTNTSPRSILKRCKSVRFAESPLEDDIPSPSGKSPPHSLRHNSLGSTIHPTKPIQRSSPLRHTYTPQCNVIPPSTKALVTAAPSLRAAGRQKSPGALRLPVSSLATDKPKAIHDNSTYKVSSPPRKPRSRSSPPLSPPKMALPKTRKAITKSAFPPKLHRRSEGCRASDMPCSVNKEIILKGRFSVTNSASRHTLDENVMRRESTSTCDGQRKRVPVPLRHIFAKLK